MKVEYGDRKDLGDCNFCSFTNAYIKVIAITGEGHGPQLQVRFCNSCFEEARKRKNNLS